MGKPPAAGTPDGADPSMEDILASIRRILNEDDVPETVVTEPKREHEVLVLDNSMMVAPAIANAAASEAEPAEAAGFGAAPADPEAEPPPPHPAMETPMPTARADDGDPMGQTLVAPETAAATAASLGSLVRTLAAEKATQVHAGGPTIEDLVRAEVRPLLKEWLDAHLPPMVERLVRGEIERVVGRAVP